MGYWIARKPVDRPDGTIAQPGEPVPFVSEWLNPTSWENHGYIEWIDEDPPKTKRAARRKPTPPDGKTAEARDRELRPKRAARSAPKKAAARKPAARRAARSAPKKAAARKPAARKAAAPKKAAARKPAAKTAAKTRRSA